MEKSNPIKFNLSKDINNPEEKIYHEKLKIQLTVILNNKKENINGKRRNFKDDDC